MSYLTVLLQVCYRVLDRCKKTYFTAICQLCRAPEPPYRADANVDSTAATARRCCGIGVRVSAPSRRGAAPYADGSLSSQTPSHLISLSILGVPKEFRPEFYIEFCVRQIGTKSPSWSLCLTVLTLSALFKGIWHHHTRHLGPLAAIPGWLTSAVL